MILASLMLFVATQTGICQSHDQVWLLGYDPNDQINGFGGSMIDFSTDTPIVSFFEIPLDFRAIASISSAQGELRLYSNGCVIVGADHQIIEGGDSINPGFIHDLYCEGGYPASQGIIFVPVDNGLTKTYRLIHIWLSQAGIYEQLRYTQIESVDDKLVVTQPDVVIDSSSFARNVSAVRHANGRDWWILLFEYASNNAHIFLSEPSGVEKVHVQQIGPAWSFIDDAGQVTFSPDGSRYVRMNPDNGVHIYDFDRCSGELSNHLGFGFPTDTVFSGGAAFSPNGRYLYISTTLKLYQYDMWAADIAGSHELVAVYDGFQSPLSTAFYHAMLAPNGKIYLTAPASVDRLHVIHNPNLHGEACNVEQHGVDLPTLHAFATPNFPHYRLGTWEGSPCDTLDPVLSTTALEDPVQVTVFPNPASDVITIEANGQFEYWLFDVLGRDVARGRGWDTEQIDASVLLPGIYVTSVVWNGKTHSKKVLVGR